MQFGYMPPTSCDGPSCSEGSCASHVHGLKSAAWAPGYEHSRPQEGAPFLMARGCRTSAAKVSCLNGASYSSPWGVALGSSAQLHGCIRNTELFVNIVQHLSPRETGIAASVCHSWQSLVALSRKLRSVLTFDATDCTWTAPVLSTLFAHFSRLEELHFCTEVQLPLEAVATIARCLPSSLRTLSAFIISNSAQGQQPAVTELAKLSRLEALTLEGTLLSGFSIMELAANCPRLRHLSSHEILVSASELQVLLESCPLLKTLIGVNLSVHHEIDGIESATGTEDDLNANDPNPQAPTQHDLLDPREIIRVLLSSLSSVESLGLNLFAEHDSLLLRAVADIVGPNLVALRLRACSFSTSALLECLGRCSRLETLSVMAWQQKEEREEGEREERGAGDEGDRDRDRRRGGSRGKGRRRGLDAVLELLPVKALPALSALEVDENTVSDSGLRGLGQLELVHQLTSLDCLDLHTASSSTFDALMLALTCLRHLRLGVSSGSEWLLTSDVGVSSDANRRVEGGWQAGESEEEEDRGRGEESAGEDGCAVEGGNEQDVQGVQAGQGAQGGQDAWERNLCRKVEVREAEVQEIFSAHMKAWGSGDGATNCGVGYVVSERTSDTLGSRMLGYQVSETSSWKSWEATGHAAAWMSAVCMQALERQCGEHAQTCHNCSQCVPQNTEKMAANFGKSEHAAADSHYADLFTVAVAAAAAAATRTQPDPHPHLPLPLPLPLPLAPPPADAAPRAHAREGSSVSRRRRTRESGAATKEDEGRRRTRESGAVPRTNAIARSSGRQRGAVMSLTPSGDGGNERVGVYDGGGDGSGRGAGLERLQRLECLSLCWCDYNAANSGNAYASALQGQEEEEEEAEVKKEEEGVEEGEEKDVVVRVAGLSRLPRLNSLQLSDWPLLIRSDLAALVKKATSLERLALTLPLKVSLESLKGLARQGSGLRHLRLIAFADTVKDDLTCGPTHASEEEEDEGDQSLSRNKLAKTQELVKKQSTGAEQAVCWAQRKVIAATEAAVLRQTEIESTHTGTGIGHREEGGQGSCVGYEEVGVLMTGGVDDARVHKVNELETQRVNERETSETYAPRAQREGEGGGERERREEVGLKGLREVFLQRLPLCRCYFEVH